MAKILLGITGSIAAYKSLELIRILLKNKHEVRVVVTHFAYQFITKTSVLALGADVYDNNNDYNSKADIMQHINLAKWPDLIVIMPLSANTLSKIAHGFSDNLLTSTIIAATTPLILVPAMNMEMWSNSIIQENVIKLTNHAMHLIGPISGLQACGDNGMGRMVEPHEVASYVTHYVLAMQRSQINFKNLKIVITLGGTQEDIDPVRFIGNKSSGKMGVELAYACHAYGAKVVIIAANVSVALPQSMVVIRVKNAAEMLLRASLEASNTDIFIGCAAVSDYKVANYTTNKIKKIDNANLTLALVENKDIIKTIKKQFPEVFVVGFAAETTNVIEYAKAKLKDKKLDLIIANDVGNNQVFGLDTTRIKILNYKNEIVGIELDKKEKISHDIISVIAANLQL